ncbi:TlyA family rRNA (cytidine-2'-O)-methyltransferase [Cellulomonas hominis]|uniref:23S rRNA (Cytidine1920-2'-O)/16S rRNA (Cytidine1409-2'-O)-methyltransferase n=1 Tax=Cellulomonas hominis TaxID=156981 RepID=A0A511FHW9_9CELL|nr:TlyA family RNA methyltransferase [Cellulomonas hominis]MBB5474484.1 23S rRNA (cytidine1920-2'-O)/16S rRNA (cytidine1409-2'-O)-methyltransferase [Cellulomonas hominis]GEL48846.1 TlyA family rRNA (cytidine-2'-O)-methyltransferase [Cellulomonas hominis]
MATRVDAALVRDGLARSRRHAAELIAAGRVSVDGHPVLRPASPLADGQHARVEPPEQPEDDWASRGAHKLLGALEAFPGVAVADRVCLDAGASTGGFTDVLLRRGARRVVAVDVGHGQLVDRLRADPRVDLREGVNVRYLAAGDVDPAPQLVVGDLSFISLAIVLPALVAVAAPDADLVLMVKPQFEVGRERLGSGGVVRSPEQRAEAVLAVAGAAADQGLGVRGVARSPLPGPSGNVEFFLWLRRGTAGALPAGALGARVREVVEDEGGAGA